MKVPKHGIQKAPLLPHKSVLSMYKLREGWSI